MTTLQFVTVISSSFPNHVQGADFYAAEHKMRNNVGTRGGGEFGGMPQLGGGQTKEESSLRCGEAGGESDSPPLEGYGGCLRASQVMFDLCPGHTTWFREAGAIPAAAAPSLPSCSMGQPQAHETRRVRPCRFSL